MKQNKPFNQNPYNQLQYQGTYHQTTEKLYISMPHISKKFSFSLSQEQPWNSLSNRKTFTSQR